MQSEAKSNGGAPPIEILPPAMPGGGSMAPGQAAVQVRGSYVTAVQVMRPRSLTEVQKRLQEEANLMGESAYYGWGAGKDAVEGPSEALAFAAARCWGNTAIEYSPVEETSDSYVFTATFIDLETGFTLQRPFRQSKRWTVYGKLDEFRKEDVRFQIGATKAARNVILKALPAWLIDGAMEQAKAGVREKIERFVKDKGLAAAQDLTVAALAKVGVPETAILAKFSIAERKALEVDKLVVLRGDLKAIQSGQARAGELFDLGGQKPSGEAETGRLGVDDLKPRADTATADAADAPTPAPPVVDDGPALFPPEKRASLVAQTERLLGVGATDAMRYLDEICGDLVGSGLEKTPASFEPSILKALEKASKARKR